ncbi:MAG TPA: hypothetical protein VMU95_23135 [Trebonia sp.]|nr:hypothetical protein [Trebonia sp.]
MGAHPHALRVFVIILYAAGMILFGLTFSVSSGHQRRRAGQAAADE